MGRSAFASATPSPPNVADLLWGQYVDQGTGIVITVLGDDGNPSQETVERAPRAYESTPIATAFYLAACLRRGNTGRARTLVHGLLRLSDVSGVAGLLARGVYPDGKRWYGDPSYLDYAAVHHALWQYFRSPQATPEEKAGIRNVIAAGLRRLEAHQFNIFNAVDDPTSLHELGYPGPGQAEHLLAMLLAGAHITADPHWEGIYLNKTRTRLDRLRQYTNGAVRHSWAMHRALASLTTLAELDDDASRRAVYQEAIRQAIAIAKRHVAAFRQYVAWRTSHPDQVCLVQQPVALPVIVPLYSAHEVIRYFHGGGAMPEFEVAHVHRLVWYSTEALAALALAGTEPEREQGAQLNRELLESVDFTEFRDARPLVAEECAQSLLDGGAARR